MGSKSKDKKQTPLIKVEKPVEKPTNLRINIKNDEVTREPTPEDRGRGNALQSSRFMENPKEILSPNYKPFEIFFNYRKNSPYVS